MKKILYTAINNQGKEVSSFIDTSSNKEAIGLLLEKGFTNIKFHDDAVTAIDRIDLDDLSDAELERIAKFETAIKIQPNFKTFILEVLRVNKFLIIGGLCLFLWGVFDSNTYLVIFGLTLTLSIPLFSMWNYRVVSGYDRLLRAYAAGRGEIVAKQTEFLRKYMKQPEMAFELDTRVAAINAPNTEIEKEIQKIEKWRTIIDELSPGMYESKVACIYHLNGNHDKYVDSMREAFFKSSESPTLILDWALAEARLGDVEKAEILLKNVKAEELPVHGMPFVNWVEGLVDFNKSGSEFEEKLSSAVSGFLEFGENPAVWPSLAVCIGDYALYAKEESSIEKSKELLSSVWEVLEFHGEKELINKLLEKYPTLKD